MPDLTHHSLRGDLRAMAWFPALVDGLGKPAAAEENSCSSSSLAYCPTVRSRTPVPPFSSPAYGGPPDPIMVVSQIVGIAATRLQDTFSATAWRPTRPRVGGTG